MAEQKIVYITSNDTPGYVQGEIYQGRIEGNNIVYDAGQAPNGVEIAPYDANTKKSVETSFNVKPIPGYPGPYTQKRLEEIYLNRQSAGYLSTVNALTRLKMGKSIKGGKRSKRKHPKRKTNRRKY